MTRFGHGCRFTITYQDTRRVKLVDGLKYLKQIFNEYLSPIDFRGRYKVARAAFSRNNFKHEASK